ncbi:MAG TPA: pirin family protein [Burkholderiales bacterium]|nr:pirin family protein [Burkholderiales bacterium]
MLETVIVPRTRDLGDGFTVRRALPATERRTVGPFVFFDHMGPVALKPGAGLDVRPHPHIGLATVTYLFAGEILHRDSLGTVQPIRPGEVNWMTAGRGIAHSERTPQALRRSGSEVSGIQVWVGLPRSHEEAEPAFSHHAAHALPVIRERDLEIRVVVGELHGARAPVPTYSPMFFADAILRSGARLPLAPEHEERGAYVVEGIAELDGIAYPAGQMLILRAGKSALLTPKPSARLVLFGGAPLEERRFLWWNFVSSRKERIDQAAADWKAGRFAAVPEETESIPLPERGPVNVDYP